jgi:hypothetical protein
MPVRKYRSVAEMPGAAWRPAGGEGLARAIASTWELAERVAPQRFPPGVYRHRSIESAERLRDAWAAANFRRFWAARGGIPVGGAAEVREPEG